VIDCFDSLRILGLGITYLGGTEEYPREMAERNEKKLPMTLG
jgi:hypothetical protein